MRGPAESFAERHPGPAEVLVQVEVADSSLGYDRGAKLRVYAAAGIPVYGIVNIPDRRLECYEEPAPGQGQYHQRTDHGPGETLPLRVGGGGVLPLSVDKALDPADR